MTQLSPFPVEDEYPTEVAGVPLSDYIDWMAACWPITVTGCPTLSLPAGFDVDGMPVGVQLVTRQGADVALPRARQDAGGGDGVRRPSSAARGDHHCVPRPHHLQPARLMVTRSLALARSHRRDGAPS